MDVILGLIKDASIRTIVGVDRLVNLPTYVGDFKNSLAMAAELLRGRRLPATEEKDMRPAGRMRRDPNPLLRARRIVRPHGGLKVAGFYRLRREVQTPGYLEPILNADPLGDEPPVEPMRHEKALLIFIRKKVHELS